MTSLCLVPMTTTGSSASTGKVSTRSISLLISCHSRLILVPSRASTVTLATPSVAVEEIFLIPSRLCSASSTARTIPSSTSSGLAPG
jgi:hypothetical protein